MGLIYPDWPMDGINIWQIQRGSCLQGWADQGLWALRAHHIHQEHAPPQDDDRFAHNRGQAPGAGELGMQPVV